MADLRPPFRFPPNSPVLGSQLDPVIGRLVQFFVDLQDRVEVLEGLKVDTLEVTDTADVANAMTAGSVASDSTVSATGGVSGNTVAATTTVAAGTAVSAGTSVTATTSLNGASADITNGTVTGTLTADTNGSAGTPSISANGVGLYTVSTNVLGIATDSAKQVEIDADGYIKQPNNCAFLVKLSTDDTNVTGEIPGGGVLPELNFDTEMYDQGGNFNTTNYTFTAPVTGTYLLAGVIHFEDLSAGETAFVTVVTSNREYYFSAPAASSGFTANQAAVSFSVIADMDANDTAKVRGIAYLGIDGNNTTADADFGSNSYWSGTLVN